MADQILTDQVLANCSMMIPNADDDDNGPTRSSTSSEYQVHCGTK
jgi:hypothetical protein